MDCASSMDCLFRRLIPIDPAWGVRDAITLVLQEMAAEWRKVWVAI
jgi:hypothetical protein